MQDIYKIYNNEIGIAFQWERDILSGNTDSYQLAFRNTGFYLDKKELQHFSNCIAEAKANRSCNGCQRNKYCKNILLRTPSEKIDLAIDREELSQIEDLVSGTLFQIELQEYLDKLCRN